MWGFCGCNRRRREEVSPVRDTREWTSVRKSCKRDDHHEDDRSVMAESDTMEETSNERGCGCRRNRNRNSNNNTMVSPSTSSFCDRQLEAARTSCHTNPLTNFNRC